MMYARLIGQWALPGMIALAIPFRAHAHDRTASYSSWHLAPTQALVVLNLSETDVAALWPAGSDDRMLPDALGEYVVRRLSLLSGDQPCPVIEPPHRLSAPAGRVILEWTLACPTQGRLGIRSDLFYDRLPGHLHFATLRQDPGGAQRVLSRTEPQWDLGAEARTQEAVRGSTGIGGYWLLGVEHIATGYDHLIFLLALLLSGSNFGVLVRVVTGFTVGHSVTLALASLGIVQPHIAPIEALIGLSIALVAVENVWLLGSRSYVFPAVLVVLLLSQSLVAACGLGRISAFCFLGFALFLACYYPLLHRSPGEGRTARWAVASIFGLIHGFAFASVLREAELPPDRLPFVLVSFNLGVEIGQIVMVALVWPLLRFALARWNALGIELGSATALALGVYWFVARTYY
ncbi:MAG: HupE/UreJ family protein [Verrucomicrobia bacterium]|nr:HupE/UreJ family protein [Verrucomicrobiota bacterium]